MSKPLNWMLSGGPAKGATSRILRNRLAVTTILAVVPFLGYGRQAYAACVGPNAQGIIQCSGLTTADPNISGVNPNVQTLPSPLFIATDGVTITGDGHVQFTDNNRSIITNPDGAGLAVTADDDEEGVPVGRVTIVTNGTITGNRHGIQAYNYGSGGISITATGNVTGTDPGDPEDDSDGIHARNSEDGTYLTITTGAGSNITGFKNGVDGRNYGSGDLEIKTYGQVTGQNFDGVYAVNEGANLKITVGAQSVVTGAGDGITALNAGEDNLEITVEGRVTSDFDGIRAVNVSGTYVDDVTGRSLSGSAEDLKITTTAGSYVRGGENGIDARNIGTGNLVIKADGYVVGDGYDGIYARNDGEDLTITTGADSTVLGAGHGIGAINNGDGDLTITVDGQVGGYGIDDEDNPIGAGIFASNSEDGGALTITTGADSTVRGSYSGITARNRGSYALTITANGDVTGDYGDGIYARNAYGTTYDEESEDDRALTITAGVDSRVTGDRDGISATNYAWGDVTITTDAGSTVTGNNDDGIDAKQYGYGKLTISVDGRVTGRGNSEDEVDAYGIDAVNTGYGSTQFVGPSDWDGEDALTNITVGSNGVVEGSAAGIRARSDGYYGISITNNGIVRNLSGESDDRAIVTSDGPTYVENNGNLIGTVTFESEDYDYDSEPYDVPWAYGYDDTLDNTGLWNTANGENDFGGGSEDAVYNSGTLLAADDAAVAETTSIINLEYFHNSGLISMVDGQAGDVFILGTGGVDTLAAAAAYGETYYESEGGRLAVDAALGPDGFSDEFIIHGSTGTSETGGATVVHVNVVSANGFNTDGIPVIRVEGGSTHIGDFVLDGPVYGGFYTWGMRLDAEENWHELYTLTDANGNPVLGFGAFQFPAGFTAVQDIGFLTLGPLQQRQGDLRSFLGITPVADFAEPVDPTPVGTRAPGFWFKGFGAYVERDDEKDGVDLDRKQTLYGGMAGFDFGTDAVSDALFFGLFAGYLNSDLDFNDNDTDWNYQGPTVGAYVTYVDQAFYADATVKAEFLDIDIDEAAGDDSDTDAVNLGFVVDTGYKFGGPAFIEPQASLAVLHTEIDDVDIFGGTVEFEDETSVRGRLGVRVGVDHTGADATVYTADVTASVWETFTGGTEVNIVVPGIPDMGATDDPGSTYGDVALGLSAANPDGWSSFVRANYLFAGDYEAYTGTAGVRFAW